MPQGLKLAAFDLSTDLTSYCRRLLFANNDLKYRDPIGTPVLEPPAYFTVIGVGIH